MITEYKLEDAGREMLITIKQLLPERHLVLKFGKMGKYLPGFQRSYRQKFEILSLKMERDWVIKKR